MKKDWNLPNPAKVTCSPLMKLKKSSSGQVGILDLDYVLHPKHKSVTFQQNLHIMISSVSATDLRNR